MKKFVLVGVILAILIGVGGYLWRNPNLLNQEFSGPSLIKDNLTSPPTSNPQETAEESEINLSHLYIESNEDASFSVMDPLGSTSFLNEDNIPRSYFTLELPIANHKDPSKKSGDPTLLFDQQYPDNGIYTISFSGKEGEGFTMWIRSSDNDSNDFISKETYVIGGSKKVTFELDNDSENYAKTTLKLID